MRKHLLFTCCALLLSSAIFSQDSLALQQSSQPNPYASAPLIVIKGELFRRFPSANFLDAVNGLFPWVFSQQPDPNQFIFVLNGFLLADVNTISLDDIEEVSFFGNQLNGALYPFSRSGTFYITTRKYAGRTIISFNSQYDAVWQKNRTNTVNDFGLVTTDRRSSHAGHLVSSHVSVSTGGEKWEWYGAGRLYQTNDPGTMNFHASRYAVPLRDSSAILKNQSMLNADAYSRLTYHFSSRLQAGITGSYFHGSIHNDSSGTGFYAPDTHGTVSNAGRSSLPNYNIAAFTAWQPASRFSNRMTAEYAASRLQYDDNSTSNGFFSNDPSIYGFENTATTLQSKSWLLRNEMKFDFSRISKFRYGVKMLFSYFHQKIQRNYLESKSNSRDGFVSATKQDFTATQAITSLNPILYFSYNGLITGYAGYAFMLNKGGESIAPASKTNPYGGLEFDIRKLIRGKTWLNRLDLSFDYANIIKNNSNNNWLPGIDQPDRFNPTGLLGLYLNSSGGPAYFSVLKTRLAAIQLNTAFFGNRLLAGIGYSKQKTDDVYPAYIFATYYAINQHSLSVSLGATIINQPSKTWTTYFNLLESPFADYNFRDIFNTAVRSVKDPLQIGLQNSFTLNNWYGQVNALLAQNSRTVNIAMVNYLLAGYHFPENNTKWLHSFSVFAQARNLFSSKPAKDYFGYYSYAGAGFNLTL